MRVPTIHLNGTGGEQLLEQVTDSCRALQAAIEKMRAAWPNARDYYVQEDGAYVEADAEWRERLDKLQGVLKDQQYIAEQIMNLIEIRTV